MACLELKLSLVPLLIMHQIFLNNTYMPKKNSHGGNALKRNEFFKTFHVVLGEMGLKSLSS